MVGLIGYETNNQVINGLGYIRYQCPVEEPIANLIEESVIDEALFDSMVEDMPTTVYQQDTELNPAVVSVIAVPVFVLGVVLGLTMFCCLICVI